ncbi:MAG TPA: hypothetical protein VM123_13365 [archaeon]|nr:hypothetical protein [archaeon]
MKSLKRALIYGLFVWLIPFLVSFLIFPLKTSNPPLFESIMPVVITICTVLFAVSYIGKLEVNMFREGILLGIIWLAISLLLDLLLFMQGPMKMTFADYMMDIGLTYLIVPAITVGLGCLKGKYYGEH